MHNIDLNIHLILWRNQVNQREKNLCFKKTNTVANLTKLCIICVLGITNMRNIAVGKWQIAFLVLLAKMLAKFSANNLNDI